MVDMIPYNKVKQLVKLSDFKALTSSVENLGSIQRKGQLTWKGSKYKMQASVIYCELWEKEQPDTFS